MFSQIKSTFNTLSSFRILALWYALLTIFVFICAFSPVYFEGDDASTIIYHLFGRNASVQPIFNPYHSGFDWVLGFLPPNEIYLRYTSFLLSFSSGLLLTYLLAYWLIRFADAPKKLTFTLGYILPFLIPEFLFQSLILNPTLFGFVFCMLGLIAAEFYLEKHQMKYLVFVPFLFLVGVPQRWSLLIFIPVVFGVFLLRRTEKGFWPSFEKTDIWFVLALFVSVIACFAGIWITGFSPVNVLEVMIWGAGYGNANSFSLSMLASNGISVFTPSLLFLVVFGLIKMFAKKQIGILYFVLFSVFPFFILGIDTSLKFLITLSPAILYIAMLGLGHIYTKRIAMSLFAILLVLPWLFGLELHGKGTDYGPGFEISQWQQSKEEYMRMPDGITPNPDERISISDFKISFKSGFAMPTIEGPRPLWGYTHTVFGGGWKEFYNAILREREEVLSRLEEKESSILLQSKRFDAFECFLFENGYQCTSAIDFKKSHVERVYNKEQHSIKVVVPKRSDTHEEMCDRFNSFKPDAVYTASTQNANGIASCQYFTRIAPFTLYFKEPLEN